MGGWGSGYLGDAISIGKTNRTVSPSFSTSSRYVAQNTLNTQYLNSILPVINLNININLTHSFLLILYSFVV